MRRGRSGAAAGALLLVAACRAGPADSGTEGGAQAAAALERGRSALELARRWSDEGSDPTPPLLDARAAYDELLRDRPADAVALLESALVEQSLGEGAAARRLLVRYCAARAASVRDDPDLDRLEGELFAAEGLAAAAARAAGRALRHAPEDVALHQRLVDLHFGGGELDRLAEVQSGLREAWPESATVAWYAGYGELLRGDAAQRERRFAAARARYAAARRHLALAAEREPGYAAMARRIDHLAQRGLAAVAIDEGDLAGAERLLLDRLAEAHDLRDVTDGLGRTWIDALLRLGAELERAGDFAAGVRVARALVTVAPDDPRQAAMWNNLGYFLREHATQLEADAAAAGSADPGAAARPLFRESWEAYLAAARLAPDDARIVNDAALIQVYHLQEDLDRARALLDQAIRVGEAQLAAMGAEPPEARRFPVAQAVGDAWLNLGYLLYHLEPDWPRARDCFERSIATDSGARAENRAYLDSIDGRRDPVPRRSAAAWGGAPRAPEELPAQVEWERGLELALARSAQERRPLFVYSRGEGLTLEVPFLDRAVRRRPLAEAISPFVCVVAAFERHCRADRDARGRRIPCPRFGAVACGEHVRAADELRARWKALRSEGEWAEPVEGFLLLAPDGSRVPLAGRSGRLLDELAALRGEPGPPSIDLAACVAELLWNEGPAQEDAARSLVGSPAARAREVVEALLGVGERARLPFCGGERHELVVPTSAIRGLLDALAAGGRPDDRELLLVLAAIAEDPIVAALALDRLPPGVDAVRVERVAQWSDDPFARAAARRALRRLDDSPAVLARIELMQAADALPR